MASEIEFVNYKQFVENLSSVDSAENTDKSVICNPVGGPRKFDASQQNKLKFFVIANNPEYLYAITDKYDRFLFGVKKDGGIEWAVGIPQPVKDAVDSLKNYTDGLVALINSSLDSKVDKETGKSLVDSLFAEGVYVVSNPEYIYAVVDKENRVLFGVRRDGKFEWSTGIPSQLESVLEGLLNEKVDKVEGKSLIDEVYSDAQGHITSPEYLKILVDASDRIMFALKPNGQPVFFGRPQFKSGVDWSLENLTELEKTLADKGVMVGVGDWSFSKELQIPLPKCAIVNIEGSMPTTKTDNLSVNIEFWDLNGNYFKKPAVLNAQGNSTLAYPKKNLTVDILNEDGSSFKLRVGDWVQQDSFHLKAYYNDFVRGKGCVFYDLYRKVANERGVMKNATWKSALWTDTEYVGQNGGYAADSDLSTQLDTGATCFPLGFPCIVYLRGAFYGIFAWQIKKHRDNYHMSKGSATHIHLDGTLSDSFFKGTIDWTDFEIRNPKSLVCMDGSDYDGDNPQELIDETSQFYDASKKSHRLSKDVKSYIILLTSRFSEIESAVDMDEKKTLIEKYFDVQNLIDYQIFCDFIDNRDGFRKNWQWTTWDGEKWFVNPYDLDLTLGVDFVGDYVRKPAAIYGGNVSGNPNYYVIHYYADELHARYAYLRGKGVLSSELIVRMIVQYCDSVGFINYQKEYEKWNGSPCNNDMQVNEEYWELVLDEDGKPVVNEQGVLFYNGTAQYEAGDKCLYGRYSGSNNYCYTFRCVNATSGQVPILAFAMRDSITRMANFSKLNEQLKDTLYGY
jgi:hypothetical protein